MGTEAKSRSGCHLPGSLTKLTNWESIWLSKVYLLRHSPATPKKQNYTQMALCANVSETSSPK
jgi:hypothetical protein